MNRNLLLSTAIALIPSACGRPHNGQLPAAFEPSGAAAESSCPAATQSTTDWRRVHTRYGGFTVGLPSSAHHSYTQVDRAARGENWTGHNGLEVSYRLYRRRVPWSPLSGSESQYECVEIIGGRTADVRAFFSDEAYIPGQYVIAKWVLSAERTLVVTAIAPEAARHDELLTIVRSVQFDRR